MPWRSEAAAASLPASGGIFFLSPELLDGASNGVAGAPNIYLARVGSEPKYVTTLESSLDVPQPPPTGHPLIRRFGSLTKPTGIAFDPAESYVYVPGAGQLQREGGQIRHQRSIRSNSPKAQREAATS